MKMIVHGTMRQIFLSFNHFNLMSFVHVYLFIQHFFLFSKCKIQFRECCLKHHQRTDKPNQNFFCLHYIWIQSFIPVLICLKAIENLLLFTLK